MATPLIPGPNSDKARLTAIFAGALCLGLSAISAAFATEMDSPGRPAPMTSAVNFDGEPASDDAREIAGWVVRTGDNSGRPFIIVDKKNAKVFVFNGAASLQGATAALLGLAPGDESAPGVGDRKLSEIGPKERTTPAGRFVASLGLNLAGQDILWVDYKTALALHRVVGANTRQHRLERLAPHAPLSRRITFGCINVPIDFYETVVRPQFADTTGVVYILPETKGIQEVFFPQLATR